METHLRTYQQLLSASLAEGYVLPQQVKALATFRELHKLSEEDHNSCLAAIGWSAVTWRSACFMGTQPKNDLSAGLQDFDNFLEKPEPSPVEKNQPPPRPVFDLNKLTQSRGGLARPISRPNEPQVPKIVSPRTQWASSEATRNKSGDLRNLPQHRGLTSPRNQGEQQTSPRTQKNTNFLELSNTDHHDFGLFKKKKDDFSQFELNLPENIADLPSDHVVPLKDDELHLDPSILTSNGTFQSQIDPSFSDIDESFLATLDINLETPISLPGEEEETLEDFNIPENISNILLNESGELKAASYTLLIAKLCSTNLVDIDDFLLTYRSFSNPAQLLNSLIQRFNHTQVEERRQVHLRIFNILGKWIEHYWFDFETDPDCTTTTLTFLNNIIENAQTEESLKDATVAKSVKSKLERKLSNRFVEKKVQTAECPPPIIDKDPSLIPLMMIDPQEIARQLTILTWEIWSAIKPWEFLGLAWTKKNGKAKHVELMTDHFNYTSGWITTTLITTPKLNDRVKLLKKFLDIAQWCKTLGNYNGVMEILSAVQRQPFFRMQKTWAETLKEKRYSCIFNELKDLTSHERSYANLRAAIQDTNPPVIPYLGMYLSDLVFIEEGNPKKIGEYNLINYFKCRSISSCIKKIQQYQQKGYPLTKIDKIQLKLKRQICISDETGMYAISNYHEPREGKEPGPKPPALDHFEAKRRALAAKMTDSGPSSAAHFKEKIKSQSGTRSSLGLMKTNKHASEKDSLSKEEMQEATEQGERICVAAWKGDLDIVTKSLGHPLAPVFVNVPNQRGQTALYCSARQGHVQILLELLNCGFCDVNLQVGDHKSTALHAAGFGGHSDCVALLLCSGGDENICNKQGLNAKQEANMQVVDVFLAKEKGWENFCARFPITNQLKDPIIFK